MELSPRTRTVLRLLLSLELTVAVPSALYGAYFASDSAGSVAAGALQGFMTGTTICVLCAAFESYFVAGDAGMRLRRMLFPVHLALKVVVYVVIIVGSIHLWNMIIERRWIDPILFAQDRVLPVTVAISLGAGLLINFVIAMRRLVGPGVLTSFFTGRYHRPIEEERAFLFIDLADSTAIAERIGHLRFHELLNRFCYDISDPIERNHGEIYKYVGDQVIVTWPLAKAVRDARCVRCFFEIEARLAALAGEYEAQFGLAPGFRAGLHAGTVVSGELGDSKQEIAFLGDTVNTTARIIDAAKSSEAPLLISQDLLGRLSLPPGVEAVHIGPIRLRGKAQEVELAALTAARA